MRFLLLLLLSTAAFADTIYICDGDVCSLVNARPTASQKVYVANTDVGSGSGDFTKNSTLKLFGSLDKQSLIGTCSNNATDMASCAKNWERVGYLYPDYVPGGTTTSPPPPTVSTFTPVVYPCKLRRLDELHIDYSGHAGAAVVFCELAEGIRPFYYCGDPAKLPAAIFRRTAEQLGILAQGNQTRACTLEEIAVVNSIITEYWGTLLQVAKNGTSATRPIYASAADVIAKKPMKERAPVGAACGFKRLLDEMGNPTGLFQYGPGYTVCNIVGAVAKP